MAHRIIGFDLARAYAILGMYIVNFNFSFGSIMAPSNVAGRFLNLFTGNSTAIFILCAGMGVSLMSGSTNSTPADKSLLRLRLLKRSWFLFGLGLLLFNWWSGDILHFYGGYMHIAAFLLFVPKRYYLGLAALVILIYHVLLGFVPLQTGWDFTLFKYTDFWTPTGFLRNTFYNGWNSMFPWFAYFLVGMYLGKLNWEEAWVRRKVFFTGLILFLLFQFLRMLVKLGFFNPFWREYISAEYFPPYLPFVIITVGFALMVLGVSVYLGTKFKDSFWVKALQNTGQLTLTNYVMHLTVGVLLFELVFHKNYTGFLEDEAATSPAGILVFSVLFYLFSMVFSVWWLKRFKTGPLELLMRKMAG